MTWQANATRHRGGTGAGSRVREEGPVGRVGGRLGEGGVG